MIPESIQPQFHTTIGKTVSGMTQMTPFVT
jgi:hypothetical protein